MKSNIEYQLFNEQTDFDFTVFIYYCPTTIQILNK